jgi:hypothetical protein
MAEGKIDRRKFNKGSPNSGRKPKEEEIVLIEKLSPLDDIAFQMLMKGVKEGSFNHLKLFYEYRYGKPKQIIDVTTKGEQIKQIFKIGNQEIEL